MTETTADELERRRRAPLTAVVTGHPGGGRDTVALGLRTEFGVWAAAGDDPGADLVVHVLGAVARDCDRELLAGERRPCVVVAGKADLRRDPQRARELAEAAAVALGRPVYPVSGLLAAARIDDGLAAALCRWAGAGERVPVPAVAFPDAARDAADRALRDRALRELGPAGLACALAAAARSPRLGPDAMTGQAMTAAVRARSGFAALVGPIRACAPGIAAARERRHRAESTVLAARGPGRDAVEARLAMRGVPR
ncbi:hypothetical protein MYK68_19725 [Gordonia sp. PP30]|uniref:hypothetical protein n=1 Tax=unclassified Gordonia (in: high G+C Gram-positive bacteria) TaxID=2657482 RepID=UPI001FFF2F71|nr:hypothetical protein [Gordonia sp. PP30]UQE74896.1 hypothetical protein MYK68_19725 [Gordonia sp. PP30]